jgi:4-amino-4-deoxy-L-arabinose transferase-like glycosyltransferase
LKDTRGSIAAERIAWCLLLLTLLVTAIIRYHLLGVPLERDEGEYAYTAQLMLQGIPPYQEVYAMKLPGIYASYALLMTVFGQTHQGVHAGLLVINAITVVFVFLLARRMISPVAAAVSAVAFALFSLDQTMTGVFANAEHFVNLFTVSGLFVLLWGLESGTWLKIFLAGLLLGCASTMKQHGLFFVAFALIYVAVFSVMSFPVRKRQVFSRLAAIVAAVAIVFGGLLLTLHWVGVFKSFWFWTVDYAREYVSEISVQKAPANFLANATPVVRSAPLFWALVGVGILGLVKEGLPKQYKIFLIGYAVFSLLSICPGYYFRPHYFLLVLPCAGILVGNGVNAMTAWIREISSQRIQYAVPTLVVAIALAHSIYLQRNYLFSMSPFQITRAIYSANPFYESLELADYIRKHTNPNDYIAILGSEPQIYFYSHRRSASGYIYMYPMMQNDEFAKVMQEAFIADIDKKDPRYILFVNVPFSWLRRSDSPHRLFDWFKDDYRLRKLEVVGVVELLEDRAVYHWQPNVKWPVDSRYWVAVFERTG